MIKISLLVPTLAQAIVYKRLSTKAIVPWVGLGRLAQGAGLTAQGSVESERWSRLLVCVSAIDSYGIHVNVGGGLGSEFARIGVSS